jgi:fluoroquinolone transport system permease protein
VNPAEYVLSKLFSIAFISTIVGVIIGCCGYSVSDMTAFIIGVFLCSCQFSSIGLIIAAKISTLNGFIVATIPAELLINIPAFAWIFGYKKSWLLFHPGVSMIELCSNGQYKLISIIVLLLWTGLFTKLTCRSVRKMLQTLGGVKL